MSVKGKAAARLKREAAMQKYIRKGYSRKFASHWYKKARKDGRIWSKSFTPEQAERIHDSGFLCGTLKHYGVEDPSDLTCVSDFDYMFLSPYNNSFSKWIDDILTTQRVLSQHSFALRKIYYSIIQREGSQLVLPIGGSDAEHKASDIVDLLKQRGALEIRPSFWESKRPRYQLEYRRELFYLNGKKSSRDQIERVISRLQANYLVADPVALDYEFPNEGKLEHVLKLWIANDADKPQSILASIITIYRNDDMVINGSIVRERSHESMLFDAVEGVFCYRGNTIHVASWDRTLRRIRGIASSLKQLDYFTMSITLRSDGGFKLLHFSAYPRLPEIPYQHDLDDYLRAKADKKRASMHPSFRDREKEIRDARFERWVKNKCRPGIRPYMQKLWMKAVQDDLMHTKGPTLKQKRWCWDHGFMSYRLWQYNLSEENCDKYLSDYDYHWLNRINNDYQKWVNDKTTYRIILDPLHQYVPKYYYSVFKRDGETVFARMEDCPSDVPESFEGLMELLHIHNKLAFKPSAGTHGDGFYCLAREEKGYSINGDSATAEDIINLVKSQKSFYVVTAYLVMHEELRKIYPNSVNTIRVMVVNDHGYDPRILQTYMRIGSSSTGFTDNVGYGGICALIEKDTGRIYQPETIKDHVFHDCPIHPDTGVEISGFVPMWEDIRKAVLDISRYLCELEYLGFDVALTDHGPEILEINIHQDLHKVALFTEEMNEFFNRKIALKKKQYGIE